MSDLAAYKLKRQLETQRNQTVLELGDLFFGDDGCKTVAAFLAEQTQVKEANFKGNNLTVEGIRLLASIFNASSSLQVVSLQWNSLGTEGVQVLCEGLADNTTLKILDLRNNKIEFEAASALARLLKANLSLEELDLRWNNLGSEGAEQILRGLESNSALKVLQLQGNSVSDELLLQLKAKLSKDKVASLRIPEYSPYRSYGSEWSPFDQTQSKAAELPQSKTKSPEQVREGLRHKQLETSIEISDLHRLLAHANEETAALKAALKGAQEEAASSRAQRTELEAQVSELKRQLIQRPLSNEPRSAYSAHSQQLDEIREACDRRVRLVEDRYKKLAAARDGLDEEVRLLKSQLLEARLEYSERLKEAEDAAIYDSESKFVVKIEGLEKRLASQLNNQKRLEQKLGQAQSDISEMQAVHAAQVQRLEQEVRALTSQRDRLEAPRLKS
jgi:hypothetical protein